LNFKTAPEKIAERKLSSNFWIALSVKRSLYGTAPGKESQPPLVSSLPTIEDLYCCGYRYKTNLQLVLFRAIPKTSSSYYSLTPFQFSLKGRKRLPEHSEPAVGSKHGSAENKIDVNGKRNSGHEATVDSADLEVVLCQVNFAASTSRLINSALSHRHDGNLSNVLENNKGGKESKTPGWLRDSISAQTAWRWNNCALRGLCQLVVICAIGIHTVLTAASKFLGLFPWAVHQSYALQQVHLAFQQAYLTGFN